MAPLSFSNGAIGIFKLAKAMQGAYLRQRSRGLQTNANQNGR
jgi:hypothetical protein